MTDETSAPEQEAPKGLDNILAAAIEAHTPAEEPQTTAGPETVAPETAETPKKVIENRDPETGKFTKKDSAAKDEAPPVQETAPAAATPAVAPVEPPKALDAPAHFTAEQRAKFATLTPEAQEIVRGTEKAREAEYTRRSQEVAEYRKTADPFVEAVKPHLEYLQQVAPQVGNTPAGMIHAIIATERTLRQGQPQERYQAFAQLAQAYGVDLRAFATGQIPVHQPQAQPVQDPRLDTVSRELAQLKAEREREVADRQITSFSTERDEQGQPRYPYFEKVKHVMASIIQSGQADNLQDAYRMATAPIQDVIDKEIAARQEAAKKAHDEQLEKAKRAAPVKSSSGAMPQGSNKPKGIDAHLKAAMSDWT